MRKVALSSQRLIRTLRIILQWSVCLGIVGIFVVTQSQPATLSASANRNTSNPSNVNTNAVTPTRSATPSLTQIVDPQKIGTPPPAESVPSRAQPAPVVIGRSPRTFPVDANTVALYHLDTQVGNAVLDATGNYSGTLYGNATTTNAGLFGGALWMDGIGSPGSYVRLGQLGNLVSGTVEAYVDFSNACTFTDSYFTILSAGSEFGGGQTRLMLGTWIGLGFGVYANGQWQFANSGINPCRYLAGGNTQTYFPYPVRWPYETWRFHHVAGTWGPRGVEIWVDGVLHGVNFPRQFDPTHDPLDSHMCNPQAQIDPNNYAYPYCRDPQIGLVPGAYAGGLPSYSTFLIGAGYDYYSRLAPFRGRIDEVRISNIQRTYTVDVVPPSSPTPTQTPDKTSGEYSVDGYTSGLYHLNAVGAGNSVKNEVTQSWNAGLHGNAVIVPAGHFNAGSSLDGNLSYVKAESSNYSYSGAIEAWINPDQTTSPYMIISNSPEPLSGYHWWALFLGMESPGTIQLTIQNNGIRYQADSGVYNSILTGCWHHVAGTWGARGMEIWVDGVLRGTNSFTGYPQIGDPYLFGCDAWSRCFKGRMDEVRISNVQRSFAPPNAPVRLRAPASDGTLTFFPIIQVAPTPVCPYG